MLALALVAALAAFAFAAGKKTSGRAVPKPFTDDSCNELVTQKQLERWANTKLRSAWEKMLAEGYDPLPGEDPTEFELLVTTEELLRRVLPTACFNADTEAYMHLFRMTWCGVVWDLVDRGILDEEPEDIIALCADETYDPRSDLYADDEDDEEPPEYDEQTGEPLRVTPDSPFIQGTAEPCTQLAPSNVLAEWANQRLRPALDAVIDAIPALASGLAADEYLDHDTVLELTDASLEVALEGQWECYDVDTDAYDQLFRWAYCAISGEVAQWGWIPNVEDPHVIVSFCTNAPPEWDPRKAAPWWYEAQPAETGMLQTNPHRGRTGRVGHLRLGRTGQGGLRLGNPGGMMAPNVSVSDVILTGQMLDAHCPGSRQHPCLDDQNRIVYPPRQNPCGPCG